MNDQTNLKQPNFSKEDIDEIEAALQDREAARMRAVPRIVGIVKWGGQYVVEAVIRRTGYVEPPALQLRVERYSSDGGWKAGPEEVGLEGDGPGMEVRDGETVVLFALKGLALGGVYRAMVRRDGHLPVMIRNEWVVSDPIYVEE